MEGFSTGRLFGLLIVVLLTSALCRPDLCAAEKSAPGAGSWILVSLAPSGCSNGCRNVYSVVQQLSGNPNGVVIHFSRLTPELVAETRPEFIILGPQGTPWCRYASNESVGLQNFFWTVPLLAEEMNIPILGICGGHQALALAFGGKVGPIRGGEFDCLPYSRERQGGVIPLNVTSDDPIFQGISEELKILQSHYDEVKVLPPGFRVLAADKVCPVQIMRHPTRPVYGIQGHPERFGKDRPDGGILIRNFLEIARTHNETTRPLALQSLPALISVRR